MGLNAHKLPDIVWCKIPAGPFWMGGDPQAWGAWAGVEFTLDYDYWVAQYPVTYAQYEAFVNSDGYTLICPYRLLVFARSIRIGKLK